MGVINHNAIIATTWDEKEFWRIKDIFADQPLFVFGDGICNGYRTVVMLPDGSKESWAESDDGDQLRDLFIAHIKEADHEDGSNPWDYVEVSFGEFGQHIVRGNCTNMYGE